MGTKRNPAAYDCYANALPDEPMFVLLARDPSAPDAVRRWAAQRNEDIALGHRPLSDVGMVREAWACAEVMEAWRKDNDGVWRKPDPDPTP